MEGITGISVLTQAMDEPYILLFSYDLQDDDLRTASITPTRMSNNVKNMYISQWCETKFVKKKKGKWYH